MNQAFNLSLMDLKQQDTSYVETLFALSNGHLGIRRPALFNQLEGESNPGTFVNGFYETEPITYGEWAYGYAENHQTMIKLPNSHNLQISIVGESSQQDDWSINQTAYELNMARGTLTESYLVETLTGKRITVDVTAFVSLVEPDVSVLKLTLTPLNFSGKFVATSHFEHHTTISDSEVIDPRVAKAKGQLVQEELNNNWLKITANSGQKILMSQVMLNDSLGAEIGTEKVALTFLADENQPVSLQHFMLISSPIKDEGPALTKLATLRDNLNYEQLYEGQLAHYQAFWQASDIELSGNPVLQKGIRFNLFHLYQNAGRDGVTNFAAKGLTGEGYEGHYFWDTEMYMLPFFTYTQPQIAKSLLEYRCSILPQAKARANKLAQKGALFAWRTINGEEASAYYPAGTAQLHINADIAYGFQLYEKVTGDCRFIQEKGAEVIFETARFWLSYGDWVATDAGTCFQINGVTGPDEYTALVNNNYYTNKMAQNNLYYAVELGSRYGSVTEEEMSNWQAAADKMKLPYDDERQLIKQDDTFFEKAPWPFSDTPKENYPLLLHYHPMVIYKHQVSKQADGLLAELLFPQDYSIEQIARDYDFYEKVTTHDSSLSRSVFSILASRTGQTEKGYNYFMDTALMDLTDLQGNSQDGIHAANMGGSWLSMIYGFGGLSFGHQQIDFTNHLPKEISDLRFRLRLQGTLVEVELTEGKAHLRLLEPNERLQVVQQTPSQISVLIK